MEECSSSLSEAIKYFLPFTVTASEANLFEGEFLFYNPYVGAYSSIEEKIKLVLMKTSKKYIMVQFWAVKRIAGTRCLLTTTHQPFSIYRLQKSYCSYRKKCMGRNINVGPEADEAQLGPPGRAFRTGFVESSPDITFYTIQEFPLRDHAILHGLKSVVALPVFELDSNNILGVLEFITWSRCPWPWSHELAINLKEVGLRFDYNGSSPAPGRLFSYVGHAGEEMYKMFAEVAKTHPLALGLALAPGSEGCSLNCSGKGCLDNLITAYRNKHMDDLFEFIEAKHHHVHTAKSVFGKAFASGKSCFCRDITNLSLLEYPLVHHARLAGLTFSFATCVQSIQDENNNVLVLQFFLLPGKYAIKNIRLFTESLLTKIKELLPSYRVAGEDFPGEELLPEFYDSLKYVVIDSVQVDVDDLSFPVPHTLDFNTYVGESEHEYLSDEEAVVDFFLPAKLCYKEFSKDGYTAAVLWSHSAEKCLGVEERIKLVFERVPVEPFFEVLIQFWAPICMEGRSFLTVLDQPFVLIRPIKKVICSYRKECMRRKIYVDAFKKNDEEQLGPAGRSFKNGVIESSPDVRLYTIQEFPLRDYAVLWGIRRAAFLPVFELDGNGSVGVLEIITSKRWKFDDYLINDLTRELKKMGLTINYDEHPQPGHSDSLAEIKEMFEAISVTHPLRFATTLTPSQGDYCHNDSALLCLATSYSNPIFQTDPDFEEFSVGNRFNHLQSKYGVAGKALTSLRACFCINICNLGIADYHFAHYAKRCGFTLAVAICVKDTQFADKLYVLEFFLLPGDYSTEYIGGLLDSLLISIEQHLPPKFKILSEDVPGEPFFLQIGNILETGNKAISSGVNVADQRETNVAQGEHISVMHVDGKEATPLVIQENLSAMHDVETEATPPVQGETISEMHYFAGIEATLLIPQGETITTLHDGDGTGPSVQGKSDFITKPFTKQMDGNKFQISLDELKLHFGKPLDKAAEDLGVSRSTLKRIRKSYGIHRWPSHKKNKVNQSLFIKENLCHAVMPLILVKRQH